MAEVAQLITDVRRRMKELGTGNDHALPRGEIPANSIGEQCCELAILGIIYDGQKSLSVGMPVNPAGKIKRGATAKGKQRQPEV